MLKTRIYVSFGACALLFGCASGPYRLDRLSPSQSAEIQESLGVYRGVITDQISENIEAIVATDAQFELKMVGGDLAFQVESNVCLGAANRLRDIEIVTEAVPQRVILRFDMKPDKCLVARKSNQVEVTVFRGNNGEYFLTSKAITPNPPRFPTHDKSPDAVRSEEVLVRGLGKKVAI